MNSDFPANENSSSSLSDESDSDISNDHMMRTTGDNPRFQSTDHLPFNNDVLNLPVPSLRFNRKRSAESINERTPTLSKLIIHLDVDCFYCQCEELSRPELRTRPLAIGQKHIVVTCNYVARGQGVKKLMLRSDARRICPDLIILEGSDLEPYRRASRLIYLSFRKFIKELVSSNEIGEDIDKGRALSQDDIPLVKKGGMDEMYADITCLVSRILRCKKKLTESRKHQAWKIPSLPHHAFIYGSNATSNAVSISEDQSGIEARIENPSCNNYSDMVATDDFLLSSQCRRVRCDNTSLWGDVYERRDCVERIHIAADVAKRVQNAVRSETGFSTCVGVSVSPMLAKIAAELQKPNSLNVLYPWRAHNIIEKMPLRRIPGIGSNTFRALLPCLEKYNDRKATSKEQYWKCRDLLCVPRSAVISCLSILKSSKQSSDWQSDLLINRCRGIDSAFIQDDDGGTSKILSVEDSFIRGSITSEAAVEEKVESLLHRLLRLLDERKKDSDSPTMAYPKVLRLSLRFAEELSTVRKQSFITRSRQIGFDGKQFMETKDENERLYNLSHAVKPLIQHLLQICSVSNSINVTRINLAATSFLDVKCDSFLNNSSRCIDHAMKTPQKITNYYQQGSQKELNKLIDSKREEEEVEEEQTLHNVHSLKTTAQDCISPSNAVSEESSYINQSTDRIEIGTLRNQNSYKEKRKDFFVTKEKHETTSTRFISESLTSALQAPYLSSSNDVPASFDRNFLQEIPSEMAAEIIANHKNYRKRVEFTQPNKGIERFFVKKK